MAKIETPKNWSEKSKAMKHLWLSTNADLLDELKNSSFLNLQFDDELNENQIKEVKEKVKKCRSYFSELTKFWSDKIPQKLDHEQILILIKSLNLLKEFGAKFSEELNKELTWRDYSKDIFERVRSIVDKHDGEWKYIWKGKDTNYVVYEDAERCLDLLYEYLNASSLEDYKLVIDRKKSKK